MREDVLLHIKYPSIVELVNRTSATKNNSPLIRAASRIRHVSQPKTR